jgi:protein TonB
MSAGSQIRSRESEAITGANPELPAAAPAPVRENPLQLLRDAIAGLRSANGDLADPAQIANLLAEARDALERANVIGKALTECAALVCDARFDGAFAALDSALAAYPGDTALVNRRAEVARQQQAFQTASVLRTALQEADWLLDQDRPDLAAQFLRSKAAALPDQTALTERLDLLESLLPEWEQNRSVQAALARAAILEQLQQWKAALTTLEEALQAYPDSAPLIDAAGRVRGLLLENERHKRLARRLELISENIAVQSWRQAINLLESTQREFPNAPELRALWREALAGQKRSECEAVIVEARRCLADGDLEQAEQVLAKGYAALGSEPALDALNRELESFREYRDELHGAQVMFGRRQFAEAEKILVALAAPDRPEAEALLEAVRQARAASEEENFCERGREKALALMQQQQYAQAADLLRNLLSLFPGNSILERDLIAAQSALDRMAPVVAPAPPARVEPAPVALAPAPIQQQPATAPPKAMAARAAAGGSAPSRVEPPAKLEPLPKPKLVKVAAKAEPAVVPALEPENSGLRRIPLVWTAGAIVVVASAAWGAWKLSRPSAPAAKPAVTRAAPPPAATPAPVTPSPIVEIPGSAALDPPAGQTSNDPAKPAPRREVAQSRSNPIKEFVPPPTKSSAAPQSALPSPPSDTGAVSVQSIPAIPAGLDRTYTGPSAPPPAPAPQAVSTPAPAPAEQRTVGGRFQEAVLIDRTLPVYPPMARQRALSGTVKLEATIDEKGAVKNVKVASGDPILGNAAKVAVATWKYRPATLNGQAIPSNVVIQVSFGDRK